MTFILNESEIEDAQYMAANDIHRPNIQMAVLTLARLMEWVNANSDGWAYWTKPVTASTKLQRVVQDAYRGNGNGPDITAVALRTAGTPIRSFLTRQGVDQRVVFMND